MLVPMSPDHVVNTTIFILNHSCYLDDKHLTLTHLPTLQSLQYLSLLLSSEVTVRVILDQTFLPGGVVNDLQISRLRERGGGEGEREGERGERGEGERGEREGEEGERGRGGRERWGEREGRRDYM